MEPDNRFANADYKGFAGQPMHIQAPRQAVLIYQPHASYSWKMPCQP